MTIAALFVESDGVYAGLPDVDLWDKARDARTYRGPHPVVAHPPCERWGRYWGGAPKTWPRLIQGNDGGCFATALHAVRIFGGVLEHPEGSHAWRWFNLTTPPRDGGWIKADWLGGWACCVEQGWYGHRARKATWLYANGVDVPSMNWGSAPGDFVHLDEGFHSAEERQIWRETGVATPYIKRAIKTGSCQRLSKRQRAATPIEFRDLLLSIAQQARAKVAA